MNTYALAYLKHGLSATPLVLEKLLIGVTPAELDHHPDPERFTLREVVAHLADWEGVWLERTRRIVTEEKPFLPGYDEAQWAIDHDYAHSDVNEQLAKFRSSREAYSAYIETLTDDQWQRVGQRDVCTMTIHEMVAMVLGHDGYHLRQTVEWLAK